MSTRNFVPDFGTSTRFKPLLDKMILPAVHRPEWSPDDYATQKPLPVHKKQPSAESPKQIKPVRLTRQRKAEQQIALLVSQSATKKDVYANFTPKLKKDLFPISQQSTSSLHPQTSSQEPASRQQVFTQMRVSSDVIIKSTVVHQSEQLLCPRGSQPKLRRQFKRHQNQSSSPMLSRTNSADQLSATKSGQLMSTLQDPQPTL